MSKSKPFTWIARFTVSPLWVADGFTLSDERAREMLAWAVGPGGADELQAAVLEAPPTQQILREQGYTRFHSGHAQAQSDIEAGTLYDGEIRAALTEARRLIASVAFVANEGDSEPVIAKLEAALRAIDPRQGDTVHYDD